MSTISHDHNYLFIFISTTSTIAIYNREARAQIPVTFYAYNSFEC